VDPLALAITLAQESGAILKERFNKPRDITEKRSRDLVTDADRASEEHIVARLRTARPLSGILGEESGITIGQNDERWIIDPLDGTTNYAHHYPFFCVSIACEQNGVVVAGVVYAPILDELFAASLGGGATCNGKPIHVSGIDQVREALVCTGFVPGRHDRNLGNFASVSREAQAVRRDGAAALDLASVAVGRFDAFWEFELKPWDVAAGALIVREAGGCVTAVDGTPYNLNAGSILATNSRIYAELRSLLTPVQVLPNIGTLSEI
jgi:myo-inositol-1(or 4)-monophosphatase